MSTLTSNFGGWVTERPTGTGGDGSADVLAGTGAGVSFVFKAIGLGCAVAIGTALSIGTGGNQLERFKDATSSPRTVAPQVAEAVRVRKPNENLARIREVFSPSISDLANTFGVTRQSIYNWLNGESVTADNAAKLEELAQAADILMHEGVEVTPSLMKRKFANGKSLFQVSQSGEPVRAAAQLLVQIYRSESIQRERMKALFANRAKTPATADFDLPAPSNNE